MRPERGGRTLLGFVLLATALYVGFQLVFSAWVVDTPALRGVLTLNAWLGSGLLRLLGHDTTGMGTEIRGPFATVGIESGCDGLQPIVLLAIAVGLVSAPLGSKLRVVLVGGLALFGLNLLRIVTLYLIQLHRPRSFELAHLTIWPFVFVTAVLTVWFLWARAQGEAREGAPGLR